MFNQFIEDSFIGTIRSISTRQDIKNRGDNRSTAHYETNPKEHGWSVQKKNNVPNLFTNNVISE